MNKGLLSLIRSGDQRKAATQEFLAGLIADVPVDKARQEQEMASLAPARHRYAVLFIPRSGSTWLAGLLSAQRLYGKPREHFEYNNIRHLAEEMNANTLSDHFAMLLRKCSTNDVFGTKVACQSLKLLLKEMAFDDVFAGYRWLFLRRRNAVAQAVSHYKALASGHPHRRRGHSPEMRRERDETERRIPYDADAIQRSLQQALDMERYGEQIISAQGLEPVRLYYEDMMAKDPAEIVEVFHRLLFGTVRPGKRLRPSPLERTATALNAEFEEQFRRERARYLSEVDRARPELKD